jgi:mono/diheme cytochrome c family protein
MVVMLAALMLSACGGSSEAAAPLAPGDAARGAQLFTQSINGAPACVSCHTVDGATLVGPSLQGYTAQAGSRVDGLSAEEYTRASITQPSAYLVNGFGNLMYAQYSQHLTPQQLADLIAYLLTL